MRKSLVLVFAMLMLAGAALAAEKWTPQQKEVWDLELQYFATWAKGDVEALMTLYHPDFMGWGYDDLVPHGKDSERKWIAYASTKSAVVEYELTPLAIQVNGNMAVAYYLWNAAFKDKKGEDKSASGRWTDILIKQDGKWLLIGGEGGKTSK